MLITTELQHYLHALADTVDDGIRYSKRSGVSRYIRWEEYNGIPIFYIVKSKPAIEEFLCEILPDGSITTTYIGGTK